MDEKILLQAHRHVLFNCNTVVENYKKLIKPQDVFDMGEENSLSFESSMQSDSNGITILENSHVPANDYENNHWVRSGIDRIEIDMDIHTQASPNDYEANIKRGNNIENESDSK
ncbi:hypothetical protein FXO37_06172 [Capsicum annuum]|nr:hypothetical protein FXO37_06172 [Capsicum annuum]